MPTFSIITITYNAEAFLERTIRSIEAQDCQDFEYIVVDGASKDGTLEIIKQNKTIITNWISEPDKGLYDAMNKGLHLAQSDFVWFMNAGDEITDFQAITKLKNLINEQIDVLYGDSFFVNNAGEKLGLRSQITPHKLPQNLKWQDMQYGMLVCHQAFIVRRNITPFYIENNLSADVDWEIMSLKRSRKSVFVDFVLANYLVGGISNKQLKRSLLDRYTVLKNHFGFWGVLKSHMVIAVRGLVLILKKGGKYW
jgi:glycosyltransferase involved in cell wall biosynthesis